jgi:NAD(P)-dependent dehydrogenase (short-subunit alcohol dehydrogenase family)
MKSTEQTTRVAPEALRGKTTIVTGAGRGIGKAIATLFAQAGARSIFVIRDREAGEQIVAELTGRGLQADIGISDVAQPAQIAMLVLDLIQRYKTIDVLVNNAGVFLDEDRSMRPSQIDPLAFQRTIDVNLLGPINMCNAFVPHISDGGRIINVSSGMGQLSGESSGYGPAYSMSKAALNMYTQLLAADLRDRKIMVDSFDPGWVRTDMGGSGANVAPEKAAETALFLATREPSSQTGLFWHGRQVIPW